jgi:hypothetical protein
LREGGREGGREREKERERERERVITTSTSSLHEVPKSSVSIAVKSWRSMTALDE